MPQTPMPEEMNVYQNAEARFEVAANKLGLEQGLYRYLKYPSCQQTGTRTGALPVFKISQQGNHALYSHRDG